VAIVWPTGVATRRRLGRGLVAFGGIGLALLLATAVLALVTIGSIGDAATGLERQRTSLVGMLEPVGATVLGWTWFRQTLSPAQTGGVVAILVGIALAQTARVSRRRLDTAVPGL
jgi:drug/metabolite transporter (DMT)-like permease